LNKRTIQVLGIVLIIIALILAIIQHFDVYNIYGDPSNKWYFYGIVVVIGIIGIIALIWSYIKKQEPRKPA
jgi:Na+/melibiose symporter-like transporter